MVFKNKALAIILFLALVLPLAYAFLYRIPPVVDAQAYDRIAVNLVAGFGFKEDRTQSYEFDTAIIRAGPGYEFFLAGVYSVFGHYYEAVWVIQALLHAFSALLLFFICRKLFSEKGELIGLIAAGLFGFHPDLIEISAMLMTETLYLFLIILTVYLFVLAHERPENSALSGAFGLVSGFAILTRPPVILFIPVILFAYYRLKRYRSAIWFIAGLALPIVPWVVRNYLIYHQIILTTLIGEYNLWVGNTLLANGGQISGGFNPLTTYTETHGFFGLKAKASAEFWSFILGYPLVFIKLCLVRFVRYFSLIRPMGFWFYQTGLKQAVFILSSVLATIVLFITGFSGLVAGLRERRPLLWYLFIFALISPAVLIPTVVQSRYRFQVYPFLALGGAYLLAMAWKKGLWKEPIFQKTVLFFLVITGIDIFLNQGIVLQRIIFLFS